MTYHSSQRECSYEWCNKTFKPASHNHVYCGVKCKRNQRSLRERDGFSGDKIDDEYAAADIRAPRTKPPSMPEVRWKKGRALEIDALPVEPGEDAQAAALRFLSDVMGADDGLLDALDLSAMSFSLLYDEDGKRQLAWIKCPVSRERIRSPRLRMEMEKFVKDISKRKPPKKPKISKDAQTTDDIWCVSDLQLGKGPEQFGGLAATIERFDWLLDEELPAKTKNAREITIAMAGDLTEGCQGSYASQPFTITLNTAEQFRGALGLLARMVDRALELAETVRITAVSSNHDQAARGIGRENVTDNWDDRSFMMLDALQLAYGKSQYQDRVKVEYPEDPLVAGFMVRNTTVAVTHGHKIMGRGEAVTKLNEWWKSQISSRHGAAAAANVMIAAHYHHHYLLRDGGRLLVGLPALDGGSGFLKDGKAVWSMPGFVTLKVDDIGVVSTQLHTWPGDRERAYDKLGLLTP